MVFKCQTDSFLKEFETKVVLCEPTLLNCKNSEGNEQLSGYNVILEDTVFFPEGGGQPSDSGFMNGKPVLDVQRKGAEAHHFIHDSGSSPPFHVGEVVLCTIDWKRRHDHMQQHSGQHLISAIFDREHNIETKSWSLGNEISYIEIDSKINLSSDQIAQVENRCNDLIAASKPVSVLILTDKNKINENPEITRATKGLPIDHVGDIRVIVIDDIDSNLCCGTHVQNLAQLQCIKLLKIERTKNRQFLHFSVGNRVLKRLQDCFERECELNVILKGGPKWHIELIKKIQASQKSNQKMLANCLKELAVHEAIKLKTMNPQPRWYSLHRKDGMDSDFAGTFLKNAPELKKEGLCLLFLTSADENEEKANLVLFGDEQVIADLGDKICNLLEGKGRGKGQRFQAKVNNLKKLSVCEKRITEYFNQKCL